MKFAVTRHYVGFWRRTGAALIDMFFFSMVALLLFAAVYGPAYFQRMAADEGSIPSLGLASFLINHILPIVVTVFFWCCCGATPGKLLLGCRIVDAETLAPITFTQALLRYVGYIVSLLPLGLGFMWIAWDKRKQGFHDKIAKTVVVFEDESQQTLAQLEQGMGRS